MKDVVMSKGVDQFMVFCESIQDRAVFVEIFAQQGKATLGFDFDISPA